ncbi:MAG: 3'-5' exonuclease [Bacteroidales bacterium]|nr:3'-5' exonuclease [Bacteroidales bacterium]
MEKFLKELNEAQREAVLFTDGPIMVIAGAGSGKTRVLTYKIAYLLKKNIDPFNILALTFTNKAANEMKERIINIVGTTDAHNMWMGTFHSVFAKILRRESLKIGYPNNFTIYDTDDSKSVIKSVIKEMDLDDKVYNPGYVLGRISAAKTSLISYEEYNKSDELVSEDRMARKPLFGQIYESYCKRCYKASAMDFDDLLFNMHMLLRNFPDALLRYQKKFKYILVDEYQDTNHCQYIILKQLAAMFENICVVGDDAQSIYSFRGANIQNILGFQNDYPDFKIFRLEQNYRSTQNIVNAANSIIVNNVGKVHKIVWTENENGEKVKILKAHSDSEEGSIVANSIFENKMNFQMQNKDFAILYRTNAQSRAFEESLRKLNIPYRIYGGLSFYQRKEIKDLIAYFRLTINNNDDEALKRIVNYPARGIGKTSIERLIIVASENNKSIWQIIENFGDYKTGLNTGTLNKLSEFITMVKSFSVQLKNKDAHEMACLVANSSGIARELYDDKTPEGISRHQNIEELLNGIKDFVDRQESAAGEENTSSLAEFMQDIALVTDADIKDKDGNDKVSIMTIHAAKGLEFPYVYISGVEENLFPSQFNINTRNELEEERRLFYVALTRAMKRVFISFATTRYRWGNVVSCEPSRFIEELDTKFIEFENKKHFKPFDDDSRLSFDKFEIKKYKYTGQTVKKNLVKITQAINSATPNNPDFISNQNIQVGMVVEHQRFGKGKVITVEGKQSDKKAIVFFENVGQKQLLLKYAKLKVIE